MFRTGQCVEREDGAEKAAAQENKKPKKVKNGKVAEKTEQASKVAPTEKSVKRKGEVSPDLEVAAAVVPVPRPKGSDLVTVTKKYKAADKLPENATKAVYASIFTSSSKGTFKETYSCRSLPLGRN